MLEFSTKNWIGGFVDYNYSGTCNKRQWHPSSGCFTNGMTHHMRNVSKNGPALYDITIWKTLDPIKIGASYFCPFSKDQIIKHLAEIQEIIDFQYVLEDESNEKFRLIVAIDMKKYPNYREHFYVMTRVRYLWEFPQSGLFYDAVRLKELVPEFNDYDLDTIYNLVTNTVPVLYSDVVKGKQLFIGRSFWYDQYHSIPKACSNLLNYIPDINKRRENVLGVIKYGNLNNINSETKIEAVKFPAHIYKNFSCYHFWDSNLGFELRVPYYIANLKRFKAGDSTIQPELPKKEVLDSMLTELDKLLKPYYIDESGAAIRNSHKIFEKDREEKRRSRYTVKDNKLVKYEIILKSFEELHPRGKDGRFIKKVKE